MAPTPLEIGLERSLGQVYATDRKWSHERKFEWCSKDRRGACVFMSFWVWHESVIFFLTDTSWKSGKINKLYTCIFILSEQLYINNSGKEPWSGKLWELIFLAACVTWLPTWAIAAVWAVDGSPGSFNTWSLDMSLV